MAWAIGAIIAVAFAAVGSTAWQSRRRRKISYAQALRAWSQAPAESRESAIARLLEETPVNAPAAYLFGCIKLGQGRMKEAARAFGMAHHGDCNLETAALLTFATLKASEGEATDIVLQIVETWTEMKQPDIFRRPEDQLVISCLKASLPPGPSLSPLGQLTWCVVGEKQRAMIESIANRPEAASLPLFA